MIQLVKADGSANKDTPLVVATLYYLPREDSSFPGAEMYCKRAGATDYFRLRGSFRPRPFCDHLEQLTRS